MNSSCTLIIVIIVILFAVYTWNYNSNKTYKEGMGGFGVTSGLAFYNNDRYSIPSPYPGAAFGGGSFVGHRVIF
ncbi:hypothetical protein OAG24_00280 [bacterium]|nr:hypothetical protein [bacterium]